LEQRLSGHLAEGAEVCDSKWAPSKMGIVIQWIGGWGKIFIGNPWVFMGF